MTFCEAIPILAGGDRVSREVWGNRYALQSDEFSVLSSLGAVKEMYIEDLTASDWYVLPLREWTEKTNARE